MAAKTPRRDQVQRTLDRQARARAELMRRRAATESHNRVAEILDLISDRNVTDHPDRNRQPEAVPRPVRWWQHLWTFLRGGTL